MRILLALSRAIDWLSERCGRLASRCVLASVLISAGNALVRWGLNASSNGWLEIQWYLFSAVFLLCASYALQRNEHVRIDVLTGRLSPRARAWIDLLGGLFFLQPMAIIIAWLSWHYFVDSYVRQEHSGNAGGLIRWPVKLLMPVGFALLALQGVSEVIKRIAFLRGLIPDPAGPRRDARTQPADGEPA
ncbi:MAG: TRAP transporter small permease subunit [Rhodospirillaceae bacterium]|nr:TRAP transporter small permease subunit [Rhodospirillaceae bacterium]